MNGGDLGIACVVGLAVVAVVIGNVKTVRRLWRSPLYEPGQKVAQTALVWLIPGSFLFVRGMMGPAPSSPSTFPRVLGDSTIVVPTSGDETLYQVHHNQSSHHFSGGDSYGDGGGGGDSGGGGSDGGGGGSGGGDSL